MHDNPTTPQSRRSGPDTDSGPGSSHPVAVPRQRFGRYTVLARLGGGGMADVYLAIARGPVERFHKLTVIKVLKQDLGGDERFVRMFLAEARLAARLAHPNIVQTFEVEVDNGRHAIVMEYLEGATLRQLLTRTQDAGFEVRRPLLALLDAVLAGLEYVHGFTDYDGSPLHLVHRDIKPANVVATFSGDVKVLDFGIAKAFALESEDPTGTMNFKGTLRYSPREAIDRLSSTDHRVDVYAAGCLLWEILSGRQVWEGMGNLEIVQAMAAGQSPPMTPPADVPPPLVALCRRALDPKVDRRIASATAFRHELLECVGAEQLQVLHRSLPGFVQAVFGDERQKRAMFVQQTVAAFEHAAAAEDEERRLAAEASARLPTQESPAVDSRSGTSNAVALVVAGVSAGLAVGGALWFTALRQPAPPSVAALSPGLAEQLAHPTPPRPPAPDLHHPAALNPIEVEVTPATAHVTLDGAALSAGSPLELSRPASGQRRELRASADGYEPGLIILTDDSPTSLTMTLEPLRAETSPSPRRRRRTKTQDRLDFDHDNPFE